MTEEAVREVSAEWRPRNMVSEEVSSPEGLAQSVVLNRFPIRTCPPEAGKRNDGGSVGIPLTVIAPCPPLAEKRGDTPLRHKKPPLFLIVRAFFYLINYRLPRRLFPPLKVTTLLAAIFIALPV